MGLDIAHLISSISKLALRKSRQKEKNKRNKLNSQIKILNTNEEVINNAKSKLNNWLLDPNKIGFSPNKIKFTNSLEYNNIKCLVFKYQETISSKWILAIVSDVGILSKMKEYNKNKELEDAIELLEVLKN